MKRLHQLKEILVHSAVDLEETGILRQAGSLALVPRFALIKELVAAVSIAYPVLRTRAAVTL